MPPSVKSTLGYEDASYDYRDGRNVLRATLWAGASIGIIFFAVQYLHGFAAIFVALLSLPALSLGADRGYSFCSSRIEIVGDRLKCFGMRRRVQIDCPMSRVFAVDLVPWRLAKTWRVKILDGPSFEYNTNLKGYEELTNRLTEAAIATSDRLHS